MKKKNYLILILSFCAATLAAQENVAALWTSLSVKKQFEKGASLQAYGEYRCKDNFASTDLFFLRMTAGYSFCPYVSAAVSYDFFGSQQSASLRDGVSVNPWMKHSHRMLADVIGSYKTGDWSFSLRERYVLAYAMPASVAGSDPEGLYVDYDFAPGLSHVFRSCPTVTYHIPDTRFRPYLSLEFYNSLMPADKFLLQQLHLFAGTSVKLSNALSMKLFYLCNMKLPSQKYLHTLGVYFMVTI